MFGMLPIDIVVIVLYFTWILWIGYRSMKRIQNQEDFFMGGRRFGKLIATFSMFGQATSGDSGTGAVTSVKQMGMAGLMFGLFPNFIAFPLFFFAAKWYRRLRLLAMSQYYELRYKSRSLGMVYAASQAIFFIIVVGLSFMAVAKTIQAMTPRPVESYSVEQKAEYDQSMRLQDLEHSDFKALSAAEQVELKELRVLKPQRSFSYFSRMGLITVLAFFVLLYAIGGGLEAAAKTDVIQSIFTLIMTVIFVPVGLIRINQMAGSEGIMGAFRSIHKILPESTFELFGSPANAEITWFMLLAMLLTLPNTLCQANNLVAAGSARDDHTAREGFMNGLILKRFATVLWGFTGLIIICLYAQYQGDPDLLWGIATRDLLGSLGLGLAGLMTACMMSGLMSLADTHMITVAALLTESVYRPICPDKSEKHYVFIGRIFSALYLAGGVFMAAISDDIWTFFKFMMTFNFMFAAPFLMGILWRRANLKAAWAGVIISSTITVIIPFVVSFTPLQNFEPLHQVNLSREIVKTYHASKNDVLTREAEIRAWEEEQVLQGATLDTPRPEALVEGQAFEKTFASRERAIFWDRIVAEKQDDGALKKRGDGLLRVEMVMLAGLGVPLEKLSYAMLETLRFIMKFLSSFLPFVLVALFTRPMPKEDLDPFYARLRTPAVADHEVDAAELAKTIADPSRFDHERLLPGSQWEFSRWDAYEKKSVVKLFVWVVLIYAALFAVTLIGA